MNITIIPATDLIDGQCVRLTQGDYASRKTYYRDPLDAALRFEQAGIRRLFEAVPSSHNGLTFCTGSLGAGRENDLVKMAAEFAPRIHFAHIRQLRYAGKKDFCEAGHLTAAGDLDIYSIVKSLVDHGFDGYVRPDHGRNIWGEDGKPGYGLYDRALGAAYLNGLFEAIEKEKR